MSDTKVKELPEAQSVGANDLLYLVASDTDYKVKGSTVKNFVEPAEMTGATSIAPGTKGLVPAPDVGDNTKYFSGDGTYKKPALSEMSDDATHRVVTDAEKGTWNAKQNALSFDDEPTDGSNNPVKSKGIYDALAAKANSADLATVATTGDYEDLTNKPTIPTIEANPSGEATAEMQKLKIDSTIYKFASQKAYNEITNVDIASFSDGADDEPLAKLEVGIEAVQSGSGEPSPSNVRPISGWSGANIYNDSEYGGFINWNQIFKGKNGGGNGLTLTVDSTQTMTIKGTATATTYIQQTNIPDTISGHVYYINLGTTNNNILLYNDNGGVGARGNAPEVVQTATANKHWFLRFENGSSYGAEGVNFQPMICDLTEMFGAGNEPNTLENFKALFPNEFYEYNAGIVTCVSAVNGNEYSLYPITFGQTVYGGKLDVTSGVLTVDRVKQHFDENNDWSKGGTQTIAGFNRFFIRPTPTMKSGNAQYGLCDKLPVGDFQSITQSVVLGYSNNTINVLSNAEDVPAFKSEIANIGGIDILYPLAENITVQLTPTQVKSLLKDNNIWADSGQIKDVVYVRDLNTYLKSLDDRITALENA